MYNISFFSFTDEAKSLSDEIGICLEADLVEELKYENWKNQTDENAATSTACLVTLTMMGICQVTLSQSWLMHFAYSLSKGCK